MKSVNNKTVFVLAAIIISMSASAREWTLDECIDHALAHNITVQQRALDCANAKQAVIEAQDGYLPTLSAGASQSWNFGRGLTADNTYAHRNTSSFGWQVGLSLPLFQGLHNFRQVVYAKANLAAVLEGFEAAKDDVTLRVMSQYLQALYCSEMTGVAKNQVDMAYLLLGRQEARLSEGKIPEADLLDMQAQLAQAEMQFTTAQNDHMLARLDLIQLLRLDESPIDFSVVSLSDNEPVINDPQVVYDRAMTVNPYVGSARSRINAADRAIKVAQTGWIPRLSFNAGLGSNYYTMSGGYSDSFGSQMRHNFSQSVGFSLSVPIFDAFSTRNSVRRARVQHDVAMLDYESATDELYKTINQAYYQAVGAREKLHSAEAAAKASEAAMNAMLEKYSIGRASYTDYENACTAWIKAEADRIQAKYELQLRARILAFYCERRSD